MKNRIIEILKNVLMLVHILFHFVFWGSLIPMLISEKSDITVFIGLVCIIIYISIYLKPAINFFKELPNNIDKFI